MHPTAREAGRSVDKAPRGFLHSPGIQGGASMKSFTALAPLFALATLLAQPASAQTTARLSYHWAPTHESAIMSKKLADEVSKRSGGKLKVDIFPSGQLYT